MGMFDNVRYECSCPVCHSKVDGFQSKDGECVLDTVEPCTVDHFYTSCRKCGCWLEFNVRKKCNTDFVLSVYGKDREKMSQHTREVHIKEG